MQKHHSSSSYLSLEALLSVGLSRDIFMDSNKNKVEASISPSGTPMNSRWNPTKEQISMLENFYTQGVRTPSAEQIQQITARLKAYGQIEGKNVFYWFQNHKARQRQKQKQENLAYMNRHNYLHKIRPLYPLPPSPNVVCSPYYLSQHSEVGYYPENQQISLPAGGLIRKRPRAEKIEKMKSVCTATEYQTPSGCFDVSMINPSSSTINNNCQETLHLFPLEPTGILQDKTEAICTFVGSPASFESTSRERKGGQTFYDFFSGHGSCYSD